MTEATSHTQTEWRNRAKTAFQLLLADGSYNRWPPGNWHVSQDVWERLQEDQALDNYLPGSNPGNLPTLLTRPLLRCGERNDELVYILLKESRYIVTSFAGVAEWQTQQT